jgi:hypothetical protein
MGVTFQTAVEIVIAGAVIGFFLLATIFDLTRAAGRGAARIWPKSSTSTSPKNDGPRWLQRVRMILLG